MNAIRFRMRAGGVALLAALLPLGPCPRASADVCEMTKLLNPNGNDGDWFGRALAASGNRVVVGSYAYSGQCENCGTVFVYRWNGSSWSVEAQIYGSDTADWGQFGMGVAFEGDAIAVGAGTDTVDTIQSGSVFVYRWSGFTWIEEAKLVPSDAGDGDRFGWPVRMSGNRFVAGARFHDMPGADDAGAAYVYEWNGYWGQQAKLVASDGATGDRFGTDVAIDGDVVVVGAGYDDHSGGSDNGSAYVYRKIGPTWVQEAKLVPSDTASGDGFGESVAIRGNRIAVGAEYDDTFATDSGSLYLFEWNGSSWDEVQKVVPGDAGTDDYFGGSVAMSDYVIVVGAHYQNNEIADHAGAAYVYHWIGASLTEYAKLLASDGQEHQWFGDEVTVNGDIAVIGAPSDDVGGKAYVIGGVSDFMCEDDPETDACAIVDGLQTDYNANLVADICWEEAFVYNVTADSVHETVAEAISQAASGDDLVATGRILRDSLDIDFDDKAITLRSLSWFDQDPDGLIVLTDGARLEVALEQHLALNGELRVEAGDTADLVADDFSVSPPALLSCRESSRLDIATADADLYGVTRVHDQATLVFTGPVIFNESSGTTVFPTGAIVADDDLTLAWQSSTTVLAAGRISANGNLGIAGSLIVDTGQMNTNAVLDVPATGVVTLNASDVFAAEGLSNAGMVTFHDGVMIAGAVLNSGDLGISGSTVFSGDIINAAGGRLDVSGELHANVTNDQDVYCLGDTLVVGDYTNNGTTTVHVGTLTIVGTLINNGTIIGDVVGGFRDGGSTQPGDGLSIAGDYVAGAAAALLLADPVWVLEVSGDYDVAIDDHTRYHMAEAELDMAGAWQAFELMSLDVGADRAGLDRTFAGHYPVGTLVIESGATVDLVDVHDNDGLGQALCEALYVRHLDLAPGSTLNTLGCAVYYETAQIDGTIDDPANVIMLPPPCPWDCDGSGDQQVSVTDFLSILAQWGQVGAPCDFDDDGVGVTDFLALLGHWGPCPE
jgi:hypothetical protein